MGDGRGGSGVEFAADRAATVADARLHSSAVRRDRNVLVGRKWRRKGLK
jgi:hypothetical protein